MKRQHLMLKLKEEIYLYKKVMYSLIGLLVVFLVFIFVWYFTNNSTEAEENAVNVENGEVLEFPTIYKEVAPPFDVSVLAKPDSALIWLKGVDSKNPDAYKIEAYVLQNINLKRVQSFAIGFTIPESLDSPSTPTQEQSQDEEQEVGF